MTYIAHSEVKIDTYWGSDTDLFVGILFLDGPLKGIKRELRIDESKDIAEIKKRLAIGGE